MKSLISPFRKHQMCGNRKGIALLLVLTMLLLLSIMVVGLLITAKQEVTTAKSYSDSSEVRSLANMTADLVISQLAQATNQHPYKAANEDVAWISQPGLLRTFSDGGQQQAFKLYSSQQMIVQGNYDPAASTQTEVPTDWWDQSQHPNEFVDLNQPVTLSFSSGNELVYPIVDPSARPSTIPTSSIDPTKPVDGVEGFSYGDLTGGSPAVPVAQASVTGQTPNALPMPVQWIYVTPGVTPDGSTTIPQFLTASKTDPDSKYYKYATARIAFWADDETSKVNINTACGGVFYDTPMANTKEDQMLGRTQPISQEYQRWPGHPSTTSIAPLFPQLRSITDSHLLSRAAGTLTPIISPSEASSGFPNFTPTDTGVYPSGSDGGTLYAWVTAQVNMGAAANYHDPNMGGMVFLDRDRLYADADEMLYNSTFNSPVQARAQRNFSTALSTLPPPNGLTVPQQINQLHFFMTTNNKSPETNLFNRPRVSLWPFNYEMVNKNANGSLGNGKFGTFNSNQKYTSTTEQMVPEDNLIQIASEIGGYTTPTNGVETYDYTQRKRLYFERSSAWNPQVDSNIPENMALFQYLEAMAAKNIPASANAVLTGDGTPRGGSSFNAKYGQLGCEQILAEMWDYIRSNIDNTNQAYQPVGYHAYSFPQNLSPDPSTQGTSRTGGTDVAPLQVVTKYGTVQGMGHYPVPVEFIFQFYNAGEYFDTTGGVVNSTNPGDPTKGIPQGVPYYVVRRVRMVTLIHFLLPIANAQGINSRFQVQITGTSPFTLSLATAASPPASGAPTPGPIYGIRAAAPDGSPGGAWLTDTTPVSMGFPFQYKDGIHRTINLVDSGPYGGNLDAFFYQASFSGGWMGSTVGLTAPVTPKETINTDAPNASTLPAGKVLSNMLDHSDVPAVDIKTYLVDPITSTYAKNAPSYTHTNRDDIFYPFCSNIIEFRLANCQNPSTLKLPNGTNNPLAFSPQPIPPKIPANTSYFSNTDSTLIPMPVNAHNEDFFNGVVFNVNSKQMTVSIYPGLLDSSNNSTDISHDVENANGFASTWQDPATTVPVFQTTLTVPPCRMPLPRTAKNNPGNVTPTATYQNLPGLPATLLSDYNTRLSYVRTGYPALVTPMVPVMPAWAEGSMQADVFRSMVLDGAPNGGPQGDVRLLALAGTNLVPGNWYVPHMKWVAPNLGTATSNANFNGNPYGYNVFSALYCIDCNIYWNSGSGGDTFTPNASYGNTPYGTTVPANIDVQNAEGAWGLVSPAAGATGTETPSAPAVNNNEAGQEYRLFNVASGYGAERRTASPITLTAQRNGYAIGDFSLGYPYSEYGALVVTPDRGAYSQALAGFSGDPSADGKSSGPYFFIGNSRAGTNNGTTDTSYGGGYSRNIAGVMFSPFRQMASGVLFGTLPSRPIATGTTAAPASWETLLFSPNPTGGKSTHRGWLAPRDHYWLDLFYMPVVEPYAETQDLATEGKINLNYQIAPFTYIQRKTGIYALMDQMTQRWAAKFTPPSGGPVTMGGSSLVAVLPTQANNSAFRNIMDTNHSSYTADQYSAGAQAVSYRKFVDIPDTLLAFDARFAHNDPFVSPSEICEMFLVPQGAATDATSTETWWKQFTLTGDDKREMPYNHLYPRVTTKSNTFRVHFWVETLNPNGLKNNTATNPAPIVTGQYRGSVVVERYLDPNIQQYGDTVTTSGTYGATTPNTYFPFLNTFYKYRKLDMRQFSP